MALRALPPDGGFLAMGEVLPFRLRSMRLDTEPDCWMRDCGCPVFYYYEDGTLECDECGTIQSGYLEEQTTR